MATYDIDLNPDAPSNAIDQELAHIKAHMANEGITVTSFALTNGTGLKLRVVTSGAPTQKILDHFKLK